MDGELKVNLLPTPRVSDSKGVDNETEWVRHSPGLAAMSFHLRSDDDPARKKSEKLFGTPQARDWKGVPGDTYNSHNLARDVSDLVVEEPNLLPPTTLAEHGDRSQFSDNLPVLPTPVTQDDNGHMQDMSADVGNNGRSVSLSDVVSRLPDGEGPVMLLPTPVVTDSSGTRNSTAWRSNPDSTAKIGDTLTDVMWKLAAERGEMELPTGPSQARFAESPELILFPTPGASDGNGGKSPKDLSATTRESGAKRQVCLPEAVKMVRFDDHRHHHGDNP